MTSKEKLIELLYAKSEMVSTMCTEYFTKEDREDIGNWDDNACDFTWYTIYNADPPTKSGLSAEVCPWCIKHNNDCNGCTYKDRHGQCAGDWCSTWATLRPRESCLTRSFYTRLLDELEESE